MEREDVHIGAADEDISILSVQAGSEEEALDHTSSSKIDEITPGEYTRMRHHLSHRAIHEIL
jgi:hypothetical protein